ncbi:ribosome biogenesis factor YjgA [Pelagibaculum spongiae]|uniref:Dual-action ribosomal maturation protein DarP n=1 Tax=Pelagibaculum spongiae TaxID=2080658 RepID=A0A2V1H3X8_9GAMM|nr:ribosome biogenesis factor YjgA [Pelagibaculum spongiae]PVZ71928.1 hypothetical protein DC094_02585 [Pelagibaculum spongiae]
MQDFEDLNPVQPEDDSERVSKTRVKQEMKDLQQLGKELAALPKASWKRLPLEDTVLKALSDSLNITANIAKKRHFQYLGRLLSKYDFDEIKSTMIRLKAGQLSKPKKPVVPPTKAELWVERLLTDSKQALTELLNEYPHADRQRINQLLRNAAKEMKPTEEGQIPKPGKQVTALKQAISKLVK